MAAVTLLEIGSAGIKCLILGGFFMSEFELRLISLFVDPQNANAFVIGYALAFASLIVCLAFVAVFLFAIDYRPRSRHLLKHQDKLDSKVEV